MLAFSRSHVQQPEPRDLNGIIVGMSDMLRRLIGEHIDLQIELTDGVPYVVADAGQIEQIIMNLVVNSRDAMPDGGRLTITTRSATLEGEEALGLRLAAGRYAVLTVNDNGHGMDSTTQSRAFEPFFTTKESGKGTGIGLATVYGIVKQSGGQVSVQSDVGAGTTLTIHLPESGEHAAKLEPGIVARATASASGTILLVEDEESVRKLTKQLLQTEGYNVLEAANGPEALECISMHVGQIDLMITDMVMPGMHGRELAIRVRRLRPGIKLLYISGYADSNLAIDDRSKILEKPFTPDELSDTVRVILSEHHESEESDASILESLSEGECA
jgi:CheY-like chemotaxis protein